MKDVTVEAVSGVSFGNSVVVILVDVVLDDWSVSVVDVVEISIEEVCVCCWCGYIPDMGGDVENGLMWCMLSFLVDGIVMFEVS
jgi:hypothetical protein